MFRATVVVVALAAISQANAAERNRRKVESLFELDADISHLEATVARTSESAPKIDRARAVVAVEEEKLSASIDEIIETLRADQAEAETKMAKAMSNLRLDIADKTAATQALAAEVNKSITAYSEDKLGKLQKYVTDQLGNYQEKQTWSNYSWDPKFPRNYELINIERAPANTQNGHKRRIFYKVKFNIMNPGFFYPNRDEMKQACTRLSQDLEDLDGVDRDLKPACDVDWACDGDGVRLSGTYLSNCGCGSRPRYRQCAGMSEEMLGGACMYNRQNSWNGCHMLRHDGLNCHHHWADCYARSGVQCEHTICTAAKSAARQVAPKGWCDPRDKNFCQGG
jgi:hypothetical protein